MKELISQAMLWLHKSCCACLSMSGRCKHAASRRAGGGVWRRVLRDGDRLRAGAAEAGPRCDAAAARPAGAPSHARPAQPCRPVAKCGTRPVCLSSPTWSNACGCCMAAQLHAACTALQASCRQCGKRPVCLSPPTWANAPHLGQCLAVAAWQLSYRRPAQPCRPFAKYGTRPVCLSSPTWAKMLAVAAWQLSYRF